MTVKIYEHGTVIEQDTCTITFKNGQSIQFYEGKVYWDNENEKIIIHDATLPYLIVSKTDGVCMKSEWTPPHNYYTALDKNAYKGIPIIITGGTEWL